MSNELFTVEASQATTPLSTLPLPLVCGATPDPGAVPEMPLRALEQHAVFAERSTRPTQTAAVPWRGLKLKGHGLFPAPWKG